ncbi:hypothetical protein IF1G_00870 [Cordyceps javanica]|uniref:Uncharacterized protein n=1 Tax=Cordyceps javanica TaxID=43265 RepID=A0A545VGS6_9HYPO|nr:hypothetical protein IF1G_00870 [Cordyceps javanica]
MFFCARRWLLVSGHGAHEAEEAQQIRRLARRGNARAGVWMRRPCVCVQVSYGLIFWSGPQAADALILLSVFSRQLVAVRMPILESINSLVA